METKSFPPVNALMDALSKIQYRDLYHKFMDAIVTLVAFVAAVATVIAQKWKQHNGAERTKAAAQAAMEAVSKAVEWARSEALPEARTLWQESKSAYSEAKAWVEKVTADVKEAI